MSDDFILEKADCRDFMKGMADKSADLIVTDPPYFRVKDEAWDRQWDHPDKFLDWLDGIVREFQRILRPNGSLYVFASPKMQARVEMLVTNYFRVLNNIVWVKQQGWHRRADKAALRCYFSNTENIIFAEQRIFLEAPVREYLRAERDRAGWTTRGVAEAFQKKSGSRTVTGMAGHWFDEISQWDLPTEENYLWLRGLLNREGGDFLQMDYKELSNWRGTLIRPFNSADITEHTTCFSFDPVSFYPGKHPCEKPVALTEHLVKVSSRSGAVVFDPFCGTGSVGVACASLGRKFIGVDLSEDYLGKARVRIDAALAAKEAVQ